MPDSAAPSPPHSQHNLCKIVWRAALILAVINLLAVVHRLPIQAHQEIGAEEAAVQQAARWIGALPPSTRIAVALSHKDPIRDWYSIRLNYLIYPRPYQVVWEQFPADAASRYDVVLTFGTRYPSLPSAFIVSKQAPLVTLALPAARTQSIFAGAMEAPVPKPLSLLPQWGMGVLSLSVVVLLGALLLHCTRTASLFPEWWARLALAHLVGAAALAWIETTAISLLGRPLLWPIYGLLFLLLAFAPMRRRQQEATRNLFSLPAPEAAMPLRAREWLLLALVALGAYTAVERGRLFGIGWDAYEIWQLVAKVLLVDGNTQALHGGRLIAFIHLDYPLLIPLQSWWTYRHIGGVNDRWVQAIGFCFYLDLLAVFFAAATRFVNRSLALVALAVLAGLPVLTQHATSGFADIGLAAYFLAVNICLSLVLIRREREAGWLLGWLLVGLALTKNEGTPACLGVLLIGGFYSLRENGEARRAALIRLLFWTGVVVLALLPWTIYKRHWGITNDVLGAASSTHFGIRLLLWRLGYALWHGFGAQLAAVGPWFPAWNLLAVLLPLGLIMSLRHHVRDSYPLWAMATLQLGGYLGVYMITNAPVAVHVSSSVDRLVLHLAPTLLYAALLGCFAKPNTPE